MTLRKKLILTLGALMGVGLVAIQSMMYFEAKKRVEQDMQHSAEHVHNTLMAMRRVYHHQFIDSELPLNDKTIGFLPAHALSLISEEYTYWDQSGFSFNNVTDQPRNPLQQADTVELAAIAEFRAQPELEKRFVKYKDASGMPFFHYSRPIWVEAYCLKCHGDQASAPESISSMYQTAYDYKMGDLRGIMSIKIPASEFDRQVSQIFLRQLIWSFMLLATFGMGILWILRSNLLTPISQLMQAIEDMTFGASKQPIPDLPGEFNKVGKAFNLMVERTELHQAELTDSEQRLRMLLSTAADAIIMTDHDGCILMWNSAAQEIFGYSRDEMVGSTIDQLIPDEYKQAHHIGTDRIRQGLPREYIGRITELKAVHKDGHIFPIEISVNAWNQRGSRFFIAFIREISERKQAEHDLRAMEETYRQFFEVNAAIKLVIDPTDGSIVQANQAAASFYGYSVDTLQRMNISEINCLPKTAIDEEMQAAKAEKRKYFNFRHRLASGDIRDVEVYSGPTTINNKTLLYSIIHDITDKRQKDLEIHDQQRRLNAIIVGTNAGTWEWNVQTGETRFNERWAEIVGYSMEELEPVSIETWLTLTHPDDLKIAEDALKAHFSGDSEQYECTARMRHKKGHWVWVMLRGRVATWTDEGKPEWMFGTHLDVTHIKNAEREAAESNDKLEAILNSTSVAIAWADEAGRIEYINPQFKTMFGYTLDDIPTVEDWFHRAYPDINYRNNVVGEWDEKMQRSLAERGIIEAMEVSIQCKDGASKHVLLQGSWAGKLLLATFSDITEQKEHQLQVEYLAAHDGLTGLPNRNLLADRMSQHMSQTSRRNKLLAVIYLDLDGFKEINDDFGHDAGDNMLVAIAHHLKETVRESDTLSRLGGDEFVIVLSDLDSIEDCLPMLIRILDAVNQPIKYKEVELKVSGSLGVTFYPQSIAVDGDQLLRQADQAMYQAKLAGKNRYHLFDAEQDRSLRGYHESIENIQNALIHNEFELHYQPKVNMRSGQIIGAEALIRWRHPEHGLISPGAFLPVIEDHPLGVQVGGWVIREALNNASAWQTSGLEIPISVNVFARQLLEPGFADELGEMLQDHPGFNANQLELEILESAALRDLTEVSRVMDACKKFGVYFALDDFGTGYSSLTYLKHLPADTLKIDQSFVRDMLVDHDDLAIVEGILSLTKTFRRKAVAEGVETIQQGSLLIQLGCDYAQGYGIARPMPADELPDWAATWRTDPAWTMQQPIPYEFIPILYAATEHRAWINQLERYIKGYDDEAPPLGHSHCRFGEWLSTEASRFLADAQVKELDALHHPIHEQAKEIMADHAHGKPSDAEAKLGQLYSSRDRLLSMLERMIDQQGSSSN